MSRCKWHEKMQEYIIAEKQKMDTEERNEIIEDIENILVLHGIAPGSIDFEKWSDEDLEEFEIEEFMRNRR